MATVEALVTELLTSTKGSLEALPMMLEGLSQTEKIVVHSAMYAMANNIALALDKQGVMSADDFLHTVGVPEDIRHILAPTNEAFGDEDNA